MTSPEPRASRREGNGTQVVNHKLYPAEFAAALIEAPHTALEADRPSRRCWSRPRRPIAAVRDVLARGADDIVRTGRPFARDSTPTVFSSRLPHQHALTA